MIKTRIAPLLAVVLSLLLVSWGTTGHFTVGLIAGRHLAPQAKNAVEDLLGPESLAEISTWADDVRGEPEYRYTAPRHYINLPLGLDYAAFAQTVKSLPGDNVYKAVLKYEQDLRSPYTSRKEKTEALKFLVHFIGDLHQPMHVSRAADKGGNTIQVRYQQEGTNLHAVWDSKLIEEEHKDYKELAEQYDQVSAQQVSQWQNEDLMHWLWESYQISSKLYKEVEDGDNHSLKSDYYKTHIPIVRQRIEMAGVRLAGVLNRIFDDTYTFPAKSDAAPAVTATPVKAEEAGRHIGEYAVVCYRIYGHKALDGLTLVNLGADYPNSLITVVLKGDARKAFKKLDGRNVCVTGKIVDYKGKPEIIVYEPEKFALK